MGHTALIDQPIHPEAIGSTTEDDLLALIDEQAVVGLDTLMTLLPQYSWSQVFHAVDRLARRGSVTLRRHRSEYTLFSSHYAA